MRSWESNIFIKNFFSSRIKKLHLLRLHFFLIWELRLSEHEAWMKRYADPPPTLPRGHLKTPLLCADSQLLFWQWGNPFWKWFSARDKEQNLKFFLIARTYFSQTAPVSNDVLPQQNAVRVLCLGSELITPHKYPTYRNWGAIRKYPPRILKGGWRGGWRGQNTRQGHSRTDTTGSFIA